MTLNDVEIQKADFKCFSRFYAANKLHRNYRR